MRPTQKRRWMVRFTASFCANRILFHIFVFCLTFWHSEKWYGEDDPIEEDGLLPEDSEVSPSLATKKINNSAVRLSARAESEQPTVKSNPRRLSTGTNRFGRVQQPAESIDSVESDMWIP